MAGVSRAWMMPLGWAGRRLEGAAGFGGAGFKGDIGFSGVTINGWRRLAGASFDAEAVYATARLGRFCNSTWRGPLHLPYPRGLGLTCPGR
jgi:hypothetical protein